MLQSLYVKNLALIDEAELDLRGGFNILSGETGAGKSIIIDSILFALGEKVDKGMVRDKDIPAMVQLTFTGISQSVKNFLIDNDLEDSDEIILTRKITDTKTIAKINDESVTAGKLREVASLLIDVHGQHEHQSLLKSSRHLGYVDAFASDSIRDIKEEIASTYKEYKRAKKSLEDMTLDSDGLAREKSFLEFEIDEIENASLKIGEDIDLEEDYRRMLSASKYQEALASVMKLTGDGGAIDSVSQALRELSSVSGSDEKIDDLFSSLTSVEDLLSDFNREIRAVSEEFVYDEALRMETENRLNLINSLKSKHGSSIEDILSACEEKKTRLDELVNYDETVAELNAQIDRLHSELVERCTKLTELRTLAAAKLSEEMTESLRDLNFLQVKFEVAIQKTEISADGADSACFMISMNPGEELKPLALTASGGELSRIMLALKYVLAESDDIGTLIFDEIDSGISGVTAQMVARKIGKLSRNHQIICITHLPQIAAMADWNYFIEKSSAEGKTLTTVRELDEDGRVMELARMLSGADVSATVIDTAKELLANCRQYK